MVYKPCFTIIYHFTIDLLKGLKVGNIFFKINLDFHLRTDFANATRNSQWKGRRVDVPSVRATGCEDDRRLRADITAITRQPCPQSAQCS